MDSVTFITTCYNQPLMLKRQVREWNRYPSTVQVLLVDDCSQEPAEKIVRMYASRELLTHFHLYRVTRDIPWARETGRNLGGFQADTAWLIFTDLDHILPVECVPALLAFTPTPGTWYLFPRNRRGRADDTRMKDKVSRDATHAKIHPHIDSFLIERKLFLKAPYQELFNGSLGGGSPFLTRMKTLAPQDILPDPVCLEVYTRDLIDDASIVGLSRDPTEYIRKKKEREEKKDFNPYPLIRLPWIRIL